MQKHVTAAELKASLSELLDRAASGEETLITRHGKPVARLAPIAAPEALPPRRPGRWTGLVAYDDERLWAPMSEEDLAGWEGAGSDAFGITRPGEAPAARRTRRQA